MCLFGALVDPVAQTQNNQNEIEQQKHTQIHRRWFNHDRHAGCMVGVYSGQQRSTDNAANHNDNRSASNTSG
jgi:hypothetical protein